MGNIPTPHHLRQAGRRVGEAAGARGDLVAALLRQLSYDPRMLTDDEIAVYTRAYSQPGATRGASDDYRAASVDVAQDEHDADELICCDVEVPVRGHRHRVGHSSRGSCTTVSQAPSGRRGSRNSTPSMIIRRFGRVSALVLGCSCSRRQLSPVARSTTMIPLGPWSEESVMNAAPASPRRRSNRTSLR